MKTATLRTNGLTLSRDAIENTTAIAAAAVNVFEELAAYALNDRATRQASAAALVIVIRSLRFIRSEAAGHPGQITLAAIEKAATEGISAAADLATAAGAPSGASVIARRAPCTLAKLKACRAHLMTLRGQLG